MSKLSDKTESIGGRAAEIFSLIKKVHREKSDIFAPNRMRLIPSSCAHERQRDVTWSPSTQFCPIPLSARLSCFAQFPFRRCFDSIPTTGRLTIHFVWPLLSTNPLTCLRETGERWRCSSATGTIIITAVMMVRGRSRSLLDWNDVVWPVSGSRKNQNGSGLYEYGHLTNI
jgi:hypothetical protein